ncbi:MAG: metallophosphoesterase [Chloroflexi bacterium]|nr:MAG: metallophosphoesterase [Chloroflexota bacterium]
MKVAVLSDIHGNLAALECVAEDISLWQPDAVIVNGDVVNRGPRPLACWRFVQAQAKKFGWRILRGNHEDYILSFLEDSANSMRVDEKQKHAYWTFQRLNGSVEELRPLPNHFTLNAPDGSELRLTHASMNGNRDGIQATDSEEKIRQQIGKAPAVFCTGHTHKSFIRQVDQTMVVNSGSVGMPFDGDWRASYAQLTWQKRGWSSKIIRLDYDRQQAERDFMESGFLNGGGPFVKLMLHEFQDARSHMYNWYRKYNDAVKNGEISFSNSVNAYLASCSV